VKATSEKANVTASPIVVAGLSKASLMAPIAARNVKVNVMRIRRFVV
jgi:hypothetical protein